MVYVPFTKAQHVTNMQNVKKQLMEILPALAKLTIMVMDSRTEPDVLAVRQMIIYYLNPGVSHSDLYGTFYFNWEKFGFQWQNLHTRLFVVTESLMLPKGQIRSRKSKIPKGLIRSRKSKIPKGLIRSRTSKIPKGLIRRRKSKKDR